MIYAFVYTDHPEQTNSAGQFPAAMLQSMIDVLCQARILGITVVSTDPPESVRKNIPGFHGQIIQAGPESGEIDALLPGIQEISNREMTGVMICTRECPPLTQSLLVSLLHAFWTSGGERIIVPSYDGTNGYPIIIPNGLMPMVIHSRTKSFPSLLEEHRHAILTVPLPSKALTETAGGGQG